MRPGARVVLAGIPAEDRVSFLASPARRKGLSLVLSRRMKHTYPRAIRLAEGGHVDLGSVVTDRFPLAETGAAFAAAATRDGLKVVVEPARLPVASEAGSQAAAASTRLRPASLAR